MTMLEVSHLRKTFGALVAVDDVSFALEAGRLVGLPGPNGAGKTTTVSAPSFCSASPPADHRRNVMGSDVAPCVHVPASEPSARSVPENELWTTVVDGCTICQSSSIASGGTRPPWAWFTRLDASRRFAYHVYAGV